MDVRDIDDLAPYIDAIVAQPPGQLIALELAPEDDCTVTPVEVMLHVHVAVIKRLLGDPAGWDLSSFSLRQWRLVVEQLACTTWRPCVACATLLGDSGDSHTLKLSQTLPGHHLWQNEDWDGEAPCIRLDAHSLVLWVLPRHFYC